MAAEPPTPPPLDGAASGAQWSATTNWIVAEGSLAASISFDTTADDAPAASPGGVLLVRPPSEDSLPCEIIVTFKEKHDIHRVYIRSTARIYEIYYATDEQNHSTDYLCTVRCGAAEEEGTACVTEGASTESAKCTDGTMEIPELPVQSDSNSNSNSNSSDEDGWIEVKVPDSPIQVDQTNLVSQKNVGSTSSNFQVHYEATAEISDASPTVSLTLRLLSLQAKTCVHIDEIYIYADPAEPSSADPPMTMGGNMGGNLLAMLVPGLLQASKFGSSKIDNRSLSDDTTVRDVANTFNISRPDIGVKKQEEAYPNITDRNSGVVQEPTKAQQESTQLRASQKVMDSGPLPESANDDNNLSYSRVEKVLNELVSRVGRIEDFCSRFEEKMMKPLGCIETRLQRLEQQLDAFAVRSQSSGPFPCSRIAAPEFSFPESDSEDENYSTMNSSPADMSASVPESHLSPGLIVKAPEFLNEDDDCIYPVDTDSVAVDCPKDSISVSVESSLKSVPESQLSPGLVVKAPEFVNEDDERTDSYDTLDSLVKDHSGDKPFSIDDALASALHAFLVTTSIESTKPSKVDAPPELSISTAPSTVRTHEEEHFCEPLFLADDATTHENLSDVENSGPTASELRNEHAVSNDSSLLADDAIHPASFSQAHSGLIVVAPEFPIEYSSSIGGEDALVSLTRNCPEDQAAIPTGCGSTSALAVFLSSMMAKSSNCSKTLLDSSLNLSNDDKKVLASSTGVLFKEDDNSARVNHGNTINRNVNLDLTLGFGVPEGSLGQSEHCERGHRCSSRDTPVEGSMSDNRPLEFSSQQKELRHDGGGPDKSDGGIAAIWEPRLNLQLDFSSSDSSFNENTVSNKTPAEWSSGINTDSECGLFLVNQTNIDAAENYRSTQLPVESFIKNYHNIVGICQPCPNYCQDNSKVEIEQALKDVNLARRNMPSEMSIDTTSSGGHDTILSGHQRVPSLSLSVDQKATTGDQPLLDVDDLLALPEPPYCLDDGHQGPGSSNHQQPFHSLI